jgi:hypothetical protein
MAWTTMHFAVGMACSGAVGVVACSVLRRGWRWLPAAMTLGGLWALLPDMPRIFREDATWLPLASMAGDKAIERWLHRHGDWFFLHQQLDAQPHEYALHGLIGILLFYNAAIWLLMRLERKQRLSLTNRMAHSHHQAKRHARGKRHGEHREENASPPVQPLIDDGPIPFPGRQVANQKRPNRA